MLGGFSDGESDAVKSLLRILAMTGAGGAAAGLGAGVLRNTNPRYDPPEVPAPVVVDMPVPAAGPVAGRIPIPTKTKQLVTAPPDATPAAKHTKAKAAGVVDTITDKLKDLGGSIYDQLPTFQHPLGATGATEAKDIPAFYAAAVPVAGAGLVGGYAAGDHVSRAVERRRAQAELDAARREYQEAVTARTAHLYFPKAAGVADLLEDRTPADPDLARAKSALDAAWAVKAADDPPLPAPSDPGRGANQSTKTLMSWLWPGLLHPDTAPYQAGLVGALGAIGAYGGYQRVRDSSEADKVRQLTEARDRANAGKLPAPVIARLVPVPS